MGLAYAGPVLWYYGHHNVMPRSTPEWVGKTIDTQVPPRVRVRVYERDGGRCKGCGRKLQVGEAFITDHMVALINGGENRESNLQTLGAKCCNPHKTRQDVKQKADTARKRAHLLGVGPKKGRPVPGSKASPWKRAYNKHTGRWETIRRDT